MSIIVFDTETTGLLAPMAAGIEHQPYLVELHAIKYDMDLKAIDMFSVRCKPPIEIPDEAVKIHGITNEDIRDCRSFVQEFPKIAEFFTGSLVLVGHNLMFDKFVLFWELTRLGKVLNFPWSVRGIDTAEVIGQYLGHRLNLQDLHMHLFGEGFSNAHSASVDCSITAVCFLEMVKKGMIEL